MIQAVRRRCREDPRVVAALMYGSFAKGEGDAFSDIEFWLFFDDSLPLPQPSEWIEAIAPLHTCFRNEFGTQVALFVNGVRGEFHFAPSSRLDVVREWARTDPLNPASWTAEGGGLEIALDRSGMLAEHVRYLEAHAADRTEPERVQALCDGFAHWALLGSSVLARGEYARALDALSHMHRYLLWMVRVLEGRHDRHWATPSRAAEADISGDSYARLRKCVAVLEAASLRKAYAETFSWAGTLMAELSARYGVSSRAEALGQRSGR
jgi:lincosamide nucleotidyltransferase